MNTNALLIPTLVTALLLSCAPIASAQISNTPNDPERRVLIDRDLNAREITLLSLTDEAIVYEDDQGRTRQASIGGLVALLPIDEPREAPSDAADTDSLNPAGVLELADGQRLPGEHATTGGDEDTIIWTHPVFGRLSINLDRVARAVLHQTEQQNTIAASADTDMDHLVLANGDLVSGFIISMGDPIEIEVDGEILAIDAQRVANVQLANPDQPMQGLVVWLDDGSVVVVTTIDASEGDALELTLPTGQTGVFPVGALDTVAFHAGRLQGLASIEPTRQRPIGERRVGQPSRILNDPVYQSSSQLRAPDIEIPGPMRIEWPLPQGARRFATIAEMPFSAIPWGDCILTVQIDSIEHTRQRISAEQPRLEINLPIERHAQTLTITIEPGAWGPINDRVTLRRPLLLLDNDPS